MAWANKPASFVDSVRAKHSKRVRLAAGLILRGVVLRSPVDTGRFRANWQIAEGQAPSGILDSTAEPASAVPDSPNDVLVIANNLPYAEQLEDGYSDQAPGGMVVLTMAEVAEKLKSMK